ncbi:cryptochrome-1 [Prunus yedoensis var. nudiflora]|uniref:Cryptochrome-1 n=1 Tax=Prunus yedoensis var. nudiflora TaxID=2094558 RepID=A0A314YR68_PRUYE|nr:cryptochrome-1 [Prunus yedoensis var. nudiflora]
MGSNKTIVWFRRDLRIEDNPALAAAARDGSVFPVYIWCPQDEGQFYPGRVSRWWLKQSLYHLDHSLRSLGAELVLIRTQSTLAALLECIEAIGATKVVFNHLYDPISLVCDHNIKGKLVELGISVQSYNADLLNEPWEVYDARGQAFTTFEAYWDRSFNMQRELVTLLPPWKLVPATGNVAKCSIEELGLEKETEKASNALLARAWSPGWSNADKALKQDKVGQNSTSLLSPYLHFGELSVRKVFQLARMKQILWAKEGNSIGVESVTLFLRAIGLREYSHADQNNFKAWRQGRTGYPLVDAGMRELWATGWIHNRIRVIVSSFAVKVLLLPWKWGMKYFSGTHFWIADLESDILGWQYISGSLPDGHELERLDSPEVQGSKFDPEGEYVRHWLPELARLPTEWIPSSLDAPDNVLKVSGVELGFNYPKPFIEIDLAREHLTKAIFKMWEMEAAAKAANSNGTDEVVVDNSDGIESLPIPKVILKNNAPCPTYSSNDQKVPTCQNSKSNQFNRKRSKHMEEERPLQDNLHNPNEVGTSRTNEDCSSTAESSMSKKQTTSRNSFSVPQSCSSSKDNSFLECESSDMKQSWQEQIDMEQSSSKGGKQRIH